MKLLVFAHTPPPHHGQSYMVELMLNGLRAAGSLPEKFPQTRIECFHVNAQFSTGLEDIGGIRMGKLGRFIEACAQAIRLRFQHGIHSLYYIPAPAKRSAIVRDWAILGLLRFFFPNVILHWHAFGLGYWAGGLVELPAGPGYKSLPPPRLFGRLDFLARALTRRVYRGCTLSLSLTRYNMTDAEALFPGKSVIVPNGIPDQCSTIFSEVLSARKDRLQARRKPADAGATPATFDLLYLAHCTQEKGLFVAMEAVSFANEQLAKNNAAYRLRLLIGGLFPAEDDKKEFDRRLDQTPEARHTFRYLGHVNATEKAKLLASCDALVFPTFFRPETFGLVLLEALSFGLPIVATRWRGIPEIVPPPLARLVLPEDSAGLAAAILESADFEDFAALREKFVNDYTLDQFLEKFREAIVTVETSAS